MMQPKTIKSKDNGCGPAPGNLVFDFKGIKVQSDRANVCMGLRNPCSGIVLVFFLLKLIGSSRGSSECRTWIEDPHHCEWKLQTSIMAVLLSIIILHI